MKVFKNLDPIDRVRIETALHKAIAGSFADDGSRVTQDETRRRFNISADFIQEMVADQHWSLSRALDHVPRYLRCKLDGIAFTPDNRSTWAAMPAVPDGR